LEQLLRGPGVARWPRRCDGRNADEVRPREPLRQRDGGDTGHRVDDHSVRRVLGADQAERQLVQSARGRTPVGKRAPLPAILGWAYCWLIAAFLVLPVIIMVPASFGASESLEFPPREWSVRWYTRVLTDPQWGASALLSVRLALLAAAIATIAGL